jgi:hypothetical protein
MLWLATVLRSWAWGLYRSLTLGLRVLTGEKSDLGRRGGPVMLSDAAGRSRSLFMPRSTGGSRSSMRTHLARLRADYNDRRRQSHVSGWCAGRAHRASTTVPSQTLEPGDQQRAASQDRERSTASRLAPGRGRAAAGRGGSSRPISHPCRPARQAPRRSQARPVT